LARPDGRRLQRWIPEDQLSKPRWTWALCEAEKRKTLGRAHTEIVKHCEFRTCSINIINNPYETLIVCILRQCLGIAITSGPLVSKVWRHAAPPDIFPARAATASPCAPGAQTLRRTAQETAYCRNRKWGVEEVEENQQLISAGLHLKVPWKSWFRLGSSSPTPKKPIQQSKHRNDQVGKSSSHQAKSSTRLLNESVYTCLHTIYLYSIYIYSAYNYISVTSHLLVVNTDTRYHKPAATWHWRYWSEEGQKNGELPQSCRKTGDEWCGSPIQTEAITTPMPSSSMSWRIQNLCKKWIYRKWKPRPQTSPGDSWWTAGEQLRKHSISLWWRSLNGNDIRLLPQPIVTLWF
jgi:hypothetical protein